MPHYAITYDINTKTNDAAEHYAELKAEFEKPCYLKTNKNFWLANLSFPTARDVEKHLKQFINPKTDSVSVVPTDLGSVACHRPLKGTSDWITANN